MDKFAKGICKNKVIIMLVTCVLVVFILQTIYI